MAWQKSLASTLVVLNVLFSLGSQALASQLPEAVLLPNVPYISWDEMAVRDYENKDVINPSLAASHQMVEDYWTQQIGQPPSESGWETERRNASDLKELQILLSRGAPVLVNLPLTPSAHPVYVIWVMYLAMNKEDRLCREMEQHRERTTSILGTFVSFDVIEEVQRCMENYEIEKRYFWDSVIRTDRVLIGYDLKKKIVILHDSNFGPALEMPINQFLRMWRITDQDYIRIIPSGFAPSSEKSNGARSYRERTPKEKAANAYVFAYGEAASGNLSEAKALYSSVQMNQNAPPSIRHLALLELAHLGIYERDSKRAIRYVEMALELEEENPLAWLILSVAQSEVGNLQEASRAHRKAVALCANKQKLQRLFERLSPSAFFMLNVCD